MSWDGCMGQPMWVYVQESKINDTICRTCLWHQCALGVISNCIHMSTVVPVKQFNTYIIIVYSLCIRLWNSTGLFSRRQAKRSKISLLTVRKRLPSKSATSCLPLRNSYRQLYIYSQYQSIFIAKWMEQLTAVMTRASKATGNSFSFSFAGMLDENLST